MIKKQAHCPRVVGQPESFIPTNMKTIFICYRFIKIFLFTLHDFQNTMSRIQHKGRTKKLVLTLSGYDF